MTFYVVCQKHSTTDVCWGTGFGSREAAEYEVDRIEGRHPHYGCACVGPHHVIESRAS